MSSLKNKIILKLYLIALIMPLPISVALFILEKNPLIITAIFFIMAGFCVFAIWAIEQTLIRRALLYVQSLEADLERISCGEEIFSDRECNSKVVENISGIAKELKNRSERLLEQIQYTRMILDAESGLVAVVSDGKVFDCNRSFLHFFDIENLEEFNAKFKSFVDIFTDSKYVGYLSPKNLSKKELISTLDENTLKIHKVVLRREEQDFRFSLLHSKINISSKEYEIFVLNDITELEMYREALEKRVAEEVDKNRLKERILSENSRRAAMGELLVNIAHQWRQPLNNVGILVQDIEDMYRFNELSKESLSLNVQKIMEQLNTLSDTISKATCFYDKQDVRARFFVRESVEKVLSLISNGFGIIKVDVRLEIPEELAISNNFQAFEEALMALFVNTKEAFEGAKKSSGEIVICASIATFDDGDMLTMTFSDNAGGIPPEILPKVFDPYFTTKFQSQGTGMGLFTVRNTIESRMYGSIDLENRGAGICFTLKIPSLQTAMSHI